MLLISFAIWVPVGLKENFVVNYQGTVYDLSKYLSEDREVGI